MILGNWSVSAEVLVPPTISSLGQHVLELGDAAGVPGDADADLVVGAADPGEFGGVELRRLVAEQRIEAGAAADDAERRAVLRRRRCRASWRAAASPRPPCSSAPRSDCRECACPCAAPACGHRGRRRRRRCSRCRDRRSCPCRNRPTLCARAVADGDEQTAAASRPRVNAANTHVPPSGTIAALSAVAPSRRHYPRRRIDLTRTRDMVLPQPAICL